MDPHPAFVTDETAAWFHAQLAALGPIKPVETYLGRDLPSRLGAWFLLNRADMIFDYRVQHGPALDERERAARDLAGITVSYQLPRDETRYAAHLVATAPAEQLRAAAHEIIGSYMLGLPEEFTEDYLEQFVPEEEEEEEPDELPLDPVPARNPRLARRTKGVAFR